MRFARNFAILLLLIASLVTALVLTHLFRPQKPLLPGDKLFPFAPETISEIMWDVRDEEGTLQTLHLYRHGEIWRMDAPYAGLLCDTKQVATFIDQILSLTIVSAQQSEAHPLFEVDRTLTVATPEKRISCAFGFSSAMGIAQVLAVCNGNNVAVNARDLAALPQSVRQLWSQALLPIAAEQLTAIEWRSPGNPFIRALKRPDNTWTVTQPFTFNPETNAVYRALDLLTDQQIITAYIRPAPGETAVVALSEAMLAAYGLDEEYAIRATFRVKGLSEPLQLRFGKSDPTRPEHLYCLLDGRQSIVSVPVALKRIFTSEGPFAIRHQNLSILGNNLSPDTIIIREKAKDATITLTQNYGYWRLKTPVDLPADIQTVTSLLETLSTLSGDITEAAIPNDDALICEIVLMSSTRNTPVSLKIYPGETADGYLAFRSDLERFYKMQKADFPEILLAHQKLNRALLDRTLVAFPAENIRRIAIAHEDTPIETVARLPDTSIWITEHPQGHYVEQATIDTWLKLFSDFKAVSVLCDTSTDKSRISAFGLDKPHTTLTLDLMGNTEQLRRILLFSARPTLDEKIPVMIQGSPLIYAIEPETFALFRKSLTAKEPVP